MLRVTFDSASWKVVASPHSFPSAAGLDGFRKIHAAIVGGKLVATVPETIFALEAVKHAWKRRFQRQAPSKAKVNAAVSEQPDGTMKVVRAAEAGEVTHADGNTQLARYWRDALAAGFRLLRCPRLAMAAAAELHGDWFLEASYEVVKRFGACSKVIESAGFGLSHIGALEAHHPKIAPPWHDAIATASVAQATAITKAVAEWADGDTVSAHYAYAHQYVCTANPGTGGATAILSQINRESMLSRINMRFITPEDLAAMI